MEFQYDSIKEAAADYKDNNLVNACILQFPYGRGGMNEKRLKPNGSITTSIDIKEYINHLSHLSQQNFHHELFSLILFNITMKQEMVRAASWHV